MPRPTKSGPIACIQGIQFCHGLICCYHLKVVESKENAKPETDVNNKSTEYLYLQYKKGTSNVWY